MSNVKTLLDVLQTSARGNDMHYALLNRREQANDLKSIDPNKWPLCCVIVPSTTAEDAMPADHSFEVLILDIVNQTYKEANTTHKQSNDYLHAKYKALDDKFYAFMNDVEGNSTNSWFIPVGDISINRLEPSQMNSLYVGISVTFTLRGQWYCPGGESPTGTCDPVTVTDGATQTSVNSGGSYTCSKTQTTKIDFPIAVDSLTIDWNESATYTGITAEYSSDLSADGVLVSAGFTTVAGTSALLERSDSTSGELFTLQGTYL